MEVAQQPQRKGEKNEVVLLALDYTTDWYKLFRGCKTAGGLPIRVEQSEWKDLHVEASATEGVKVHIKASDNPLPFSTQKDERVVVPDFCLIRNFPMDIHDNGFKNMVIGLLFGDIPAVNSLESVLRCMERPVVYAAMLKLQRQLGPDRFPLIAMNYYPNLRASTRRLIEPESYPAVIKVSSTHAGYGKTQARDKHDMQDITSILALHNDYYTTEPFIEHEYEFRVQKIGDHYRAFRRNSASSWKNNWGKLTFVDHEMTADYKLWVDEVAKLFGGLDILALDVLHAKDGKDYIIEVNDTAPGLMWEHEEEDLGHIRDLALKRMSEAYD